MKNIIYNLFVILYRKMPTCFVDWIKTIKFVDENIKTFFCRLPPPAVRKQGCGYDRIL